MRALLDVNVPIALLDANHVHHAGSARARSECFPGLGLLLSLAVERRGRLVTLDEGVPISAVKGAKHRHLVVVA